jgi:transcription elongation factor GreA
MSTTPKPAEQAGASTPANNPSSSARVILSPEGERAMRAELERLRHELETGTAERLKEAREYGSGSENDDMLQIREEEAVLAARVARLEQILARAEVVADADGGDVATVGTVVELRDLDSGKVAKRRIVGGHEQAGADTISVASPVGRALLGQEAGARVSVELPNGRRRELEIVSIEAA